MKLFQRVALIATASLIAGATGYGVSYAAGGGRASTVPNASPVAAGLHDLAGPGASPRPPAVPESTYVAVKNCRLVNTSLAGGRIAAGHNRAFYVVGTAGFTGQGGTSGGCGIPASATAISARVTAVSATANGAFVAYPTGTPVGQGTLYYAKGVNVTTGANIQLGSGSGQVLTVANVAGNGQLIIDVNGYFQEQMQGMIASDGSIYSGSNRIVSATVINPGVYRVTFDTDVSYCTPHVTTYSGKGVYGSAYGFAGNSIYVYTWYISGTTHLEVANPYYFYITVTC